MAEERITCLFGDLEKVLRLLKLSQQIRLLENFIEKAQRTLSGEGLFLFLNFLLVYSLNSNQMKKIETK